MRDHMPDPNEYPLEDSEETGSTECYFFLRYRDSATVVYKVTVKVTVSLQLPSRFEAPKELLEPLGWFLRLRTSVVERQLHLG